jgi:NAD(P)H-hydrate epimerase
VIPFYQKLLPYLTTEQMREVDRLMIEVYHIDLIQMMENAGRNLATLARERFLDSHPQDKQIVILAGTGGNGGGALVCARWLHNAGADVHVVLVAPRERLTPVPARQLDILHRMGIVVSQVDRIHSITQPDLIIDGLIGYSLKGSPRGSTVQLINWANETGSPILSLDVPSGLDTSTGQVFDPAIEAIATMTLALPKEGLRADSATAYVGELYLANISVPPELYAELTLGLTITPIFTSSDILRIR